MVKRLLCLLFVLLMLPCAALADAMVIDDALLFDPSDIETMEQVIQRIEEEYQMDILVLTTYDVPSTYSDAVIQDYADVYFDNNGYGLGEDRAGFLYMIDMTNRAPCISTSGVMIDYITDHRLEELFETSYDVLAAGRYGWAAVAVLNRLEQFLDQGREEGSFRYDEVTGQRLTGLYNALTGSEMLVALMAGIGIAILMYAVVSSRYNLKGSTYRYDQESNASCSLTKNEEKFLHQTVRVVRHESSSGSGGSGSGRGSSVRTSSSGRSHGGGVGRRF